MVGLQIKNLTSDNLKQRKHKNDMSAIAIVTSHIVVATGASHFGHLAVSISAHCRGTKSGSYQYRIKSSNIQHYNVCKLTLTVQILRNRC